MTVNADCFDVVIVGAGLSGIGAACHLRKKCPNKSFAILESRNASGGTWDLFRYPGIRSDSDMHTYGYSFKPWRGAKMIADGASILQYVREAARENRIDKHIRYGYEVKKANWSSADAAWLIEAQRKETGERVCFRCNILLMCSGYYSYQKGHTPDFSGRETFRGKIVHPQEWPEDLDYRNKNVVVIGSGATAMTLVPAVAKDAKHVVMLQRSPTYAMALPAKDRVANLLRALLPEKLAYALIRWKNVALQQFFYRRLRDHPVGGKHRLIGLIRKQLGPGFNVEKHFTPSYDPWDQRLCIVPNGDLFKAIRSGKVSVETDQIDSFTKTGIRLKSGKTLEADIIVTATGLNLLMLGGIVFSVDDKPVDFSQTFTYKGMMYSDVPNLISTFGYVNASWTLRADLTAEFVCRLINHMEKTGFRQCTPRLREEDRNMPARPYLEHFSPGYVQRAIHLFPKQGDHPPWVTIQNYREDKKLVQGSAIDDGVLQFTHRSQIS